MEPDQILTILSIGAIVLGALFWIIDSRLGKVLREFRPNGGSSVKDQLDRIETKIDGHLNWHLDRTER